MPRKCCIIWDGKTCDGNYANTNTKDREQATIFTFPSNKDEERKWIESLPNLLTVSSTSYLGVRHWPEGYPAVTSKMAKRDPLSHHLFLEFLSYICNNVNIISHIGK